MLTAYAHNKSATIQFRHSARRLSCRANTATTSTVVTAKAPVAEEFYEVSIPKPLGLKFGKGRDGAAYVTLADKQLGNIDPRIKMGDKVVAVSASFGEDVWDAKGYGQTMYAIRTRNGDVYMKFQNMFGDTSMLEEDPNETESEKMFKRERSGGNVGAGTREIQTRNYVMRKELERKRRELFDDSLAKFRAGKLEDALVGFEEIIGMEPRKYISDNFERVSEIYKVTQYNIACAYSALGKQDEALIALEAALEGGFEKFDLIRKDKSLANLRADPRFQVIMDKYDAPWVNREAISFITNIFGKKN